MIDLRQYGYTETETPADGMIPGRVTEQHRDHYIVICRQGEVQAFLKGSFIYGARVRDDLPCVGDYVLLKYNESGPSQLESLLPRRSKFSRSDSFGHSVGHVKANREQVVAANFDFVFILTSLNLDFNVNRVARYITQAWQSGGQPVIVLTKADLTEDFSHQLDAVREIAPGVPVHACSSRSGYGLEGLEVYLQPCKTIVFLGMSGVGKSSLLNALMNEDVMEVSAIREDDSRGRHTTTHRRLFMLPSGAMVIDTPGMRELGIVAADEGISAGFKDVEDLFGLCRFSDCRHTAEPGCAVLAAIADGSLSHKHWERYLAQKRENKYVDDKRAYLQEVRDRGKSIAKFSRQIKKHGKK